MDNVVLYRESEIIENLTYYILFQIYSFISNILNIQNPIMFAQTYQPILKDYRILKSTKLKGDNITIPYFDLLMVLRSLNSVEFGFIW